MGVLHLPETVFCFDLESTGLNPEKERITCLGAMTPDGLFCFSGDERKLIENFYLLLAPEKHLCLLSFNGVGFDVPFIAKRAKILGFEPLFDLAAVPQIDLMLRLYPFYAEAIGPTSTGRISKEMVLDFLNIYSPRVGSAKHCVFSGKYLKDSLPIMQHNVMDLVSTMEIYRKAKAQGWIE